MSAEFSVLIVEDQTGSKPNLVDCLSEADFDEIEVMSTGEKAFQAIKGRGFDQVVVDTCMEGQMAGIELARKFRHHLDQSVIFVISSSGATHWTELMELEPEAVVKKPVRNDELNGHLELARKRRQRQLEQDIKLRALSETAEGIVITDPSQPDNPIIYANDGFLRLTGYDLDETIGRNCRFLQGEGTRDSVVNKLRRAINDAHYIEVEILNYRKDGEQFWNRLSITPVKDESGQIINFIGIQKDITQQKSQEEKLRKTEKLAAIGEISAGLMHEINNPNQFIRGNTQYLSKIFDRLQQSIDVDELSSELADAIDQEIPSALEDMLEGSRRIETIVDDVENFSRQESQDEFIAMDPIPLIKDAFEMVKKTQDDDRDIDVTSDIQPEPGQITVHSSKEAVIQIVRNLLQNAYDAAASDAPGDVQLTVQPEPNHLIIEVQDTGPGISNDVRTRIFEPFFTTKSRGQGTGLGLSITKGLVNQMNGSIDFESNQDGTTFRIKIPLESS